MSLLDIFGSCFPCITSKTPTLKINNAQFKILDLLGEGGFSYVYLVQSQSNKGLYALKKIRCPFGNSNFKVAMKEVDNYREFKSPYIIKCIDSSIVQEPDGSKTIYILLPYFENGSLQDIINNNSVNNVKMDEDEALRLFIGVCRGLISMHRHQLSQNYSMTAVTDDALGTTAAMLDDELQSGAQSSIHLTNLHTEPEEHNPFISETDRLRASSNNNNDSSMEGTELSDTISMAHRDIKPANVMLSKDGTPL
ncbi:unnamed protein product [Ambrosiozyma monospora]|uniref:non-specific serine/threonine protein kinase n=1 Tax=Ambrosiozyma monospora TaxID=43982 RepID=A0A9W6Z4S0_AMBMO|nr:unnamed protein product [Ambrosiozyma monospora]